MLNISIYDYFFLSCFGVTFTSSSSSSFGLTTVVGQGLPVPLVGLAFNEFQIAQIQIVNPMYGGTVYLGELTTVP